MSAPVNTSLDYEVIQRPFSRRGKTVMSIRSVKLADGTEHLVTELAERAGVSAMTIRARLRAGLPYASVITPVRSQRSVGESTQLDIDNIKRLIEKHGFCVSRLAYASYEITDSRWTNVTRMAKRNGGLGLHVSNNVTGNLTLLYASQSDGGERAAIKKYQEWNRLNPPKGRGNRAPKSKPGDFFDTQEVAERVNAAFTWQAIGGG